MKPPAAVTLVTLALAGCSVGPRVEKFRPAQEPAGVETELRLANRTIAGELLALENAGLLVLSERRVVRVPYRAIQRGSFGQLGLFMTKGVAPPADKRERLRLVSRFPQGLSEDLLRDLLAAYGQAEVEVVVSP